MHKAWHMKSKHGVDARGHVRASGAASAPQKTQAERRGAPSAGGLLQHGRRPSSDDVRTEQHRSGSGSDQGTADATNSDQQRVEPADGLGGQFLGRPSTPSSSQVPHVPAANGPSSEDAVEAEMAELMATTRMHAEPSLQPQKRRRVSGGAAGSIPEYRYATLATELRATYEGLRDWARSKPIIEPRKRCRPGRFDSYRLRALQRFCLTVAGGAGLTLAEQEELYNLLGVWEGTKPGMPVDAGHNTKLRDIFESANAFKNALRDDIDAAILNAGWRKCTMRQSGDTFTGFFKPVLDVVLKMVAEGKNVQLWSGDDGAAPPTGLRESPMDGDAFRLNEAEVIKEHGPSAFVLGMHGYSDASHISKSGGKRAGRQVGRCAWMVGGGG